MGLSEGQIVLVLNLARDARLCLLPCLLALLLLDLLLDPHVMLLLVIWRRATVPLWDQMNVTALLLQTIN